jgi:hypothetical protein
MLPKKLRTYMIVNIVMAVLLGIVMEVRNELGTGRHLLIDIGLILFFSSALAALVLGPFALVEIFLYRKRKGIWYQLQGDRPRVPQYSAATAEELRRRKSEAIHSRLTRGDEPPTSGTARTRLFESITQSQTISRAALLLSVADKLEQSGKKEAAERCYRQIMQRFPDSPQAIEACRRL